MSTVIAFLEKQIEMHNFSIIRLKEIILQCKEHLKKIDISDFKTRQALLDEIRDCNTAIRRNKSYINRLHIQLSLGC